MMIYKSFRGCEGEDEGEFTDEKIIQSNHTTCFDRCLDSQSSGMLRIIYNYILISNEYYGSMNCFGNSLELSLF
jgi:hypothetical protein